MYKSGKERQVNTISENVYYTLRKNILDLNLKPGENISIKDIAEELGISRSPVRDAILKLGKEGLLDIVPQSSTIVSKIDLDRVTEERFLRQALEEKVLLIFLESHTPNDIRQLEKRIGQQEDYLAREDYHEFLEYDDLFHEVFFKAAHKEMCWDLIRSMSGHYRRVRFMSLWNDSVSTDILKEHKLLLTEIQAGHKESLLNLIREHTDKQQNQGKSLSKKFPEYFVSESSPIDNENFLKKDFNMMNGR